MRAQGPRPEQAAWMDRGTEQEAVRQIDLLWRKAERNHGLSLADQERLARWKDVLAEARSGSRTANAEEVACEREPSRMSST